jgi:hypothetical protein
MSSPVYNTTRIMLTVVPRLFEYYKDPLFNHWRVLVFLGFIYFLFTYETESCCVSQTGPKLPFFPSQPLTATITDMCHHSWPLFW